MSEPAWVEQEIHESLGLETLRARRAERIAHHRDSKSQEFVVGICQFCQRIDFEYMFFGDARSGFRNESETHVVVGYLEDIDQRAGGGCPFCRCLTTAANQILKDLVRSSGTYGSAHPRASELLVELTAMDHVLEKRNQEVEWDFDCSIIRVCLLSNNSATIKNAAPERSNKFVDLQLWDHSLARLLTLQPWIQVQMCKSWLEECCWNHEKCNSDFEADMLGAKPDQAFRLIDVKLNQIIQLGSRIDKPYATLSYVCGDPNSVWKLPSRSDSWSVNEQGMKIHPLPGNLPSTVADAITVVKALGLQYLWVDSFCISQDDPVELQRQIGAMFAVYTNALFCIIAASGKDSHAGLPGISFPRKVWPNRQVSLKQGMIVGVPPATEMYDVLPSYKWMTRGWTFQELILSKRCIIFTDQEVFFYCASVSRHESLKVPYVREGLDGHWSSTSLIGNTALIRANCHGRNAKIYSLATFHRLVEHYSRREFSYQTDGLNAFKGLARFMEKVLNARMIHGCPDKFLVDCLSWRTEAERNQSKRRMQGTLMNQPLSPSWTWVSRDNRVIFDTTWEAYIPGTEMQILYHSPIPWMLATPATECRFVTAMERNYDGGHSRTLQGLLPVFTRFAMFEITANENQGGGNPNLWNIQIPEGDGTLVGNVYLDDLPRSPTPRLGNFLQIWLGEKTENVLSLFVETYNFPDIHGIPGDKYVAEFFSQTSLAKTAMSLTAQVWKDTFFPEVADPIPEKLLISPSSMHSKDLPVPLLVTRAGLGRIERLAWTAVESNNAFVLLG